VLSEGMLGNLDNIAASSSSLIFSNSFKVEASSFNFSTFAIILSASFF